MFALERPFNSWDAVKLLALLLMFIDHVGNFFFATPDYHWLRAIGRGAAPIFLFLAGYASSYRFKWDLFALAILMTISDVLLTGHLRTQNILVTILVTRMLFHWVERKQNIIKHPYEWQIGALFWLTTMPLMQYGTFGIVFGICGYVQRRSEHYPPQLSRNLLIIAFISYALVMQYSFHFTVLNMIIGSIIIGLVGWLLYHLKVGSMDTSHIPQPVVWLMQKTAAYSGYIYAFHLIALEWITGRPF